MIPNIIDTSGPPSFKSSNIGECRDYIHDSTGTHRFDLKRTSSLLEFVHYETSVGRVSINFVNMNCSDGFRMTKAAAAPYYSFQFLVEGSCHLEGAYGTIVANPGDVFVLNPDHITREFWPKKCTQFVMRIDRDLIEAVAGDELGRKLSRRLSFEPVSSDPGIGLWLRHVSAIMSAGDGGAAMLIDKRVSRNIERALIAMVLGNIRHTESVAFERPASAAAPYYVKRAEEYIRTHTLDDLNVETIAAAVGVSPRSMFYGFKRWRDTTPMAHVRDVRLDIARRELEKMRQTGGTVSQAAANAGFTNFSQFSKIYKARFGETPSTTLLAD